jgi:hypothetical protein
MSKAGWITACVAVFLAVLTVGLYRHYRIQPLLEHSLDSASHDRKRVRKATSLFCSNWAEHPVSRVVLLQLVPKTRDTRPLISINEDETETWSQAREWLARIYSTRADRVVFVVDNADVDKRYRSELMDMLEQSPVIEDVCVIDPNNPPSWYPLQRVVMPKVAQR